VRTFKIIPDDFVELAAPDEKERFEAEIREVRRENLRLKAELHQVKEDREILKKAAAYFAKNPD
jgi:transposase